MGEREREVKKLKYRKKKKGEPLSFKLHYEGSKPKSSVTANIILNSVIFECIVPFPRWDLCLL